MKIAFVDQSHFDYTSQTPLHAPLGGMQCGLAFLAAELARRGHEVTVFNGVARPLLHDGVHWVPWAGEGAAPALPGFEVVIANQTGGVGLRRLAPGVPMLLWSGHYPLEPSMQALADPGEFSVWSGFVFNTAWQTVGFVERFGLPASHCAVINKAVAPVFEANVAPRQFFFEEGRPPVLHYSSTPFRGLAVLLRAFPAIRRAFPGATLQVCSSMRPYQVAAQDDAYGALYRACQAMDGVRYLGSLAQPELARAVATADVLAFPSAYPETGCITLMEAMISGCLPVCRDLGALRETAAGFGAFYRIDDKRGASEHARVFAQHLIATLLRAGSEPARFGARLREQQRFAAARMTWSHRAGQWETLLRRVVDRWAAVRPVSVTSPDLRSAAPTRPAFRTLLARAMRERGPLGIVQVGANDGRINDPLYEVVMSHPESARILLIEPQPEILEHLKRNYAEHPDTRFWCGAIGPPGALTLHRVRPRFWGDFKSTHFAHAPAYRAPSGFASSSLAHVRAHARAGLPPHIGLEDAIEAMQVPSTGLEGLLSERFPDFGSVDVLQIDAEGMDHVVLAHCAIAHYRPLLVQFEHAHLEPGVRLKIAVDFERLGYRVMVDPQGDTLAVRGDHARWARGA